MRVCDALQALAERRHDVKPSEFFLLTELVFLGNGEVEVPCSSRELARKTELSRRQVQHLIDQLSKNGRGILDVERGTGSDFRSLFRLKFLPSPGTPGDKTTPPPGEKTAPPALNPWRKECATTAQNGRHTGEKTAPPVNKERARAQLTDSYTETSGVLKSVQTNLGLTIYKAELREQLAALPQEFGMCERSVCRFLQTKYEQWEAERRKVSPGLVLKAAREELETWGNQEGYESLECDRRVEEAARRRPPDPAPPPRMPPVSAEELRSMIAEVAAAKRMR